MRWRRTAGAVGGAAAVVALWAAPAWSHADLPNSGGGTEGMNPLGHSAAPYTAGSTVRLNLDALDEAGELGDGDDTKRLIVEIPDGFAAAPTVCALSPGNYPLSAPNYTPVAGWTCVEEASSTPGHARRIRFDRTGGAASAAEWFGFNLVPPSPAALTGYDLLVRQEYDSSPTVNWTPTAGQLPGSESVTGLRRWVAAGEPPPAVPEISHLLLLPLGAALTIAAGLAVSRKRIA